MACADLVHDAARQRDIREIGKIDQAGPQAIVDVMGVVGDVVGDGRDLRLGARLRPELQRVARVIGRDGGRQGPVRMGTDGMALPVGERAVVFDHPSASPRRDSAIISWRSGAPAR